MFDRLQRITAPNGAGFTVGRPHANTFGGLFDDLAMAGYDIKPEQSGGYANRNIAGTSTPSRHAFGEAVDVNWTDNARGTSGTIPPDLARQLAAKHGMIWGGDWSNPDPMHFEVNRSAGPRLQNLELLKQDGSNARAGALQMAGPRDYAWNDALPIEEAVRSGAATPTAAPMGGGGLGGNPDQPKPSFLDQILSPIMNPLTMAGMAGLEASMRGDSAFPAMRAGQAIGAQHQETQRQAMQQAALKAMLANGGNLGNIPPALREIARVTGDVGPITQFLVKQADPNAGRTDDIKEYEYALKNGFKGSLQDWMVNKRASQGEYNKVPVYGTRTGANGQPETVMLQTGSRGDAVATRLPEGVSVNAQKPLEIDAGTHTVLLDPITRQPIANIPKNKAEVARQGVVGDAQGKAQADLPGVESNADNIVRMIDDVAKAPGLDTMIGYRGYLPNVTPEARGLQAKIDQLKGQSFLMAFQNLKGAGAITEMEGAKASAALSRLQEMAQNGADYRQALKDFRDEVERLRAVARQKAGGGASVPSGGFSIRRLD